MVLVISDLDPVRSNKQLEKVSFMKEVGRKLFHNDSMCQDPMNWVKLRVVKRTSLTGANVSMVCNQAGQIWQRYLGRVEGRVPQLQDSTGP